MPTRTDLMITIDNAVFAIIEQPPDEIDQWISYFFESLESELGESAITEAMQVLQERLDTGAW